MKIGVTFNVRTQDAPSPAPPGGAPSSRPPSSRLDDEQEEFDSPETIRALAESLAALGHEVELLGYGEPLVRRLLDGPRPDLVWNIAEGHGGGRSREARVPALLEMLDIPYTFSDPLTLAATLDKDCAKRLAASAGVATPEWFLFEGDWQASRAALERLEFPVFVKPAHEGSSKGILASNLVRDLAELERALGELYENYRQAVLVEEFVDGDELTVGVLGTAQPHVIGIMRILPRDAAGPFVYSLEVKRDWQRRVRYDCPAQLALSETRAVERAALACWKVFGCRDVARFDFRLRRGVPYFLEANPLPGMSPESGDLVLLAGHVGIEYRELIERVLNAALERLAIAESAKNGLSRAASLAE